MEKVQGVWSWRHCVRDSTMPALAKFVCLNLSTYMQDDGRGCYPGIALQVEKTGLSRSSVLRALSAARDAGYVQISKVHGEGKKYARNFYVPCFPRGVDLAPAAAPIAAPSPDDSEAAEWESEDDLGVCETQTGCPCDTNRVSVGDPKSTYKGPYKSPIKEEKKERGNWREGTLYDEGQTDFMDWLKQQRNGMALSDYDPSEERATPLPPSPWVKVPLRATELESVH